MIEGLMESDLIDIDAATFQEKRGKRINASLCWTVKQIGHSTLCNSSMPYIENVTSDLRSYFVLHRPRSCTVCNAYETREEETRKRRLADNVDGIK